MHTDGTSSQNITKEAANITLRRGTKSYYRPHTELQDSLCVDSILSKSEMEEIQEMLASEDRSIGGRKDSGIQFMTLTQMNGGKGEEGPKPSILMSPIIDANYQNPSCAERRSYFSTNNRFSLLAGDLDLKNSLNILDHSCITRDNNVRSAGEMSNERGDAIVPSVMKDSSAKEVSTLGPVDPAPGQDDPDPGPDVQHVANLLSLRSSNLETSGLGLGERREPTDNNNKPEDERSEADPGEKGNVGEPERDDDDEDEEKELSPLELSSKLTTVSRIIGSLTCKPGNLEKKVEELCTSLEYSQKEIGDLKAENISLRKRLEEVETEEECSRYQIKTVEDKLDKVETYGKKKNLIIEGLQESDGGREDIEKTIRDLFDQLNLDRGLEFDACYRVGGFSRNRTRPILLSFLKQADRELVYMKRMELRRTVSYTRLDQ